MTGGAPSGGVLMCVGVCAVQRKKEDAKMSYDEYMKAKAAEAKEAADLKIREVEAIDMKGLKIAVKGGDEVHTCHTRHTTLCRTSLERGTARLAGVCTLQPTCLRTGAFYCCA